MYGPGPVQRVARVVPSVPASGPAGDLIFSVADNAAYIANNAGTYQVLDTGTGDIGGSTGSVDNAALRADGTGGKTLQSSPVIFDDSGNVIASNVSPGLLSTATAAGTTVLTVASKGIQVFTGSTTQTVTLPVVTTLPQIGFGFVVQNDSSGAVTVNSSGGNAVQVMAAGTRATFTCKLLTGTTAASWNVSYLPATFGVTNSAGANVVPKSDGTNLVASQITDDGTTVSIASANVLMTSSGGVPKISGAADSGYLGSYLQFDVADSGALSGGNISMNSGDTPVSFGSYVLAFGATGAGGPAKGGNIQIEAGDAKVASGGNGGDVQIDAGQGDGAGTNGAITLTAGAGSANTMVFNGAGLAVSASTESLAIDGVAHTVGIIAATGVTVTTNGGVATFPSGQTGTVALTGTIGSVLSVLSANATLASATGTTYSSPGYGGTPLASTSEAQVGWVCPRAGTISKLYVITGSVAKVNTPATTITLRKAGADTAVTLTLTQTTATVSSDLTHSFSVAAGDVITISFTTTGAAAVSTSIAGISFVLN